MQQYNLPQTDASNRQTLRTKQSDDMELLVAASEVETLCADWLVDQRINARQPAS